MSAAEIARPRLDEIEKRASEATAGNWSTRDGLDEFGDDGLPDIVVNSEWLVDAPIPHADADAEFIAHARSDVPALTAALRDVLALAEEWRYKGEFGRGPWQAGDGPSPEGQVLDRAAAELHRAIAARIDVTSPTLHSLTDTRGPRA